MVEGKIQSTVGLPEGFSAAVDHRKVTVKCAQGEATRNFKARGISFKAQDKEILIEGKPASRKMNALMKTLSSHIRNMVAGLQQPYVCKLAIIYSHFPMNVAVKGNVVEINNFTGEKFSRRAKILPGVSVEVKGKDVIVKGTDKEATGQTAANLENATKVRGKDRRVYQDGIFVVKKAKQEEAAGKGKQEGEKGGQ